MIAVERLVAAGFIIFWITVFAIPARRMLELRVGLPRLILSGAAGLTVGVVAVGRLLRDDQAQAALIFLFVGVGVLSAMGLLIIAEIIAPAGTRRVLSSGTARSNAGDDAPSDTRRSAGSPSAMA